METISRGLAAVVAVLCLLSLVPASTQEKPRAAKANPFVGAWRLVSVEDRRPPTRTFQMGKTPQGRIIYTESGQMAVQITRNPQDKVALEYDKAGEADVRTAYEQYYAYFGAYTIDWERKVVTHKVEASLRPNEIGLNYERAFTLEGNRLTLVPLVDGKPSPAKLTWEKVE